MKFLCLRCWNTGLINKYQHIPRSELSARDLAELLVLGGYAYRLVEVPCDCGRTPKGKST